MRDSLYISMIIWKYNSLSVEKYIFFTYSISWVGNKIMARFWPSAIGHFRG